MSVDFYVALPATNWPTAAAVQKCMTDRGFPITIKRFPVLDNVGVVNDGVLAAIDGKDAYLEGGLLRLLPCPKRLRTSMIAWREWQRPNASVRGMWS